MKKKIKAWIEIHETYADTPTISTIKPLPREVINANEFGYKVFECEILIGKEIKYEKEKRKK